MKKVLISSNSSESIKRGQLSISYKILSELFNQEKLFNSDQQN